MARAIRGGATLAVLVCALVLATQATMAAAATPVDSLWQRIYNGNASGEDTWSRAAPGPNGGVMVGGTSAQARGGGAATLDMVLARYAADGRRLWFRAFDGPGGSDDWLLDLAADGRGNTVAVGIANGSVLVPRTQPQAAAIVKYGPQGQLRWARTYLPPSIGDDVQFSVVAIDASGFIYAGGYGSGANATPPDPVFLVKYSPAGKRLWVRRYANSTFATVINDIALDGRGGIYLTGSTDSSAWDMITLKYRADGSRAWVRILDDPDSGSDGATAITVVGRGVYVAGYMSKSSIDKDATIVKYSTGGAHRWERWFSGGTTTYEAFADIVGLADGGVAATGTLTSDALMRAHNDDALFVGLSADGSVRWSAAYNNAPEYLDDSGSRIVQARNGAIYIAGRSIIGPGRDPDVLLLKFSARGAFRWARTHGAGTWHESNALVAIPGGVYVAATEYNTINNDGLLLKYVP